VSALHASPVRVRAALPRDLAACAAIFAAGQQEIAPSDPPWAASGFAEATAGEEVLVARCDEVVVGFLTLWRRDRFVHFLHVAAAWRGRGAGRQLLAAAARRVAGPLELKCLPSNAAALSFYRRLGWVEVESCLDAGADFIRLRQRV
jgi:ribosomal protein S18 acetylase RimI-like enzyme